MENTAMDDFNSINSRFMKYLIISVCFFIVACSISFFSYDYLFYFVLTVDITFIFFFLFHKDPIYLLYLYIFSVFFDINEVFTFGGEYFFRIWYLVSFYVLAREIMLFISKENRFVIKKKYFGLVLFFISLSFFSVISMILNAHKIEAMLFVAKIYLFYIPIVIAFVRWADNERMVKIMYFMLFMIFWVSLFGIFEFLTKIQGIEAIKYKLFVSEELVRPNGFFSETTWMGIMGVIGLILAIWMYSITGSKKKFYVLSIPSFIIIILSATRGAYLAFAAVIILVLMLGNEREKKIVATWFFLLSLFFIIFYNIIIEGYNPVIIIYDKFTKIDKSVLDRQEGFLKNIFLLRDNILFGLGFGYNDYLVGSKTSNIFFSIFSSFGIIGFLVFLFSISVYIVKYLRLFFACDETAKIFKLYGFLFFIVYMVYSQVAPLHLIGFGWVLVAISIAIFTNLSFKKKDII